MNEKIYEIITVRGSNKEYIVDSMEYPFQQFNVLYIKFIVYKDIKNIDEKVCRIPTSFLIIQPQDVLTRSYPWSQEHENKLVEASELAIKKRNELQKVVEKEIVKQGNETNSQGSVNDDDEIIDPDFKTKFDPGDPSFG